MFLQYYLNEEGEWVYTLKKFHPMGQQTCSAHPAQFSPDDKYSRHRITNKKRFKVLMTQQPCPVL
ncbi:PREDICTED: H/ACA ribonucleoprotein complex subunit 3-like [Elephantulus edwardii]|uniref:H/ACA ribonucleoprotein complex subunit 3-like n=1 Tax=Elephantulus edwardii TaxID=28737 RepID=UPI0003F0F2F3|nr:PREDICTED: H/ACA ribonucleoprotein complex subunit 3-like [Elephantulus edwardii]